MGGQIAGDGDKDVLTLVGVAPLAELADASRQDLMGVETPAQQCPHQRGELPELGQRRLRFHSHRDPILFVSQTAAMCVIANYGKDARDESGLDHSRPAPNRGKRSGIIA
jgi:hypothetical protein